MKFNVTLIVRKLHVRETYLVEAADEWKARTRAMGEYLCGRNVHPEFTGSFVEYEVTEALPLFAGDWEFNTTLDAWEVAYPAVRYGSRWNGWATPVVARQTLEALVARNQFLRTSGMPDLDRMEWQGDSLLVLPFDVQATDPQVKDYLKVLVPEADGTYDLGVLGYTFEQVAPGDNVVRAVPATPTREQRKAWIVDRIMGEVLADIDAGTLPQYPASFSELHDYVDANTYGGLCDDNADFARPWVTDEVADLNAIQDAVHDWLVARAAGAQVAE